MRKWWEPSNRRIGGYPWVPYFQRNPNPTISSIHELLYCGCGPTKPCSCGDWKILLDFGLWIAHCAYSRPSGKAPSWRSQPIKKGYECLTNMSRIKRSYKSIMCPIIWRWESLPHVEKKDAWRSMGKPGRNRALSGWDCQELSIIRPTLGNQEMNAKHNTKPHHRFVLVAIVIWGSR